MIPYPLADRENSTSSLYIRFELIKNTEIEEGTMLSSANSTLDPYDYHVSNWGKTLLWKRKKKKKRSCYVMVGNERKSHIESWINLSDMKYWNWKKRRFLEWSERNI